MQGKKGPSYERELQCMNHTLKTFRFEFNPYFCLVNND
jgi:hypothetical protein